MFIDTSAIIAILLREPEAASLAAAIDAAARRFTSPLVRLEACMVLATRTGMTPLEAQEIFDAFLREGDIAVLPIDDAIGVLAVQSFHAFGKGRNRARLNLSDCMSYACAKRNDLPILFVGKDFSHTDIAPAQRR